MNAISHLGFFSTIVESMRQTLVLQTRLRLLLMLLGLAIGAFVLGSILAARADERSDGRFLFCLVAWWLGTTVVVPWGTLYLGVQAVHGPLEDRTYLYNFLRPVSRAALFLGQWLAVSAFAAVASAVLATALFLGVAGHADRWPDGVQWELLGVMVQTLALAALAYAAVAAWFGAFFRRPLAWGAFFVVGLQMLTANLPVSAGLRQLTITDPLRRFVLDGVNPEQRLTRALWPAERDFHPDLIGEPLRDLLVLVAVCLVLGLWSYTRTEYDARNRE